MALFLLLIFFLIFIVTCSDKNDLLKNDKRSLQSTPAETSTISNISIYVNYDCLVDVRNSDEGRLLIRAINNAKYTLEKLIKVKKLDRGIYLKDYESLFNNQFQGCINLNQYSDGDLFILIRKYSATFDGTIEFATPEIFYHLENNIEKRPLIGGVAFKLDSLVLDDEDSKYQALSTIFLHEFTHILGFNKTIMQQKKLIEIHENAKRRMNDDTYTNYSFIGSKALNIAKSYFNCTFMTGIELDVVSGQETKEKDSTKTIHCNERILMGDYMIPSLYYIEQAISEITLASLEDLGYYEINYYTGGLMRFGKNKGCNFFSKDCIEEFLNISTTNFKIALQSSFPNEFCSSVYEGADNVFGTCSPGRQSMAFCFNRMSYPSILDNKYRRLFSSYGVYLALGFSPTQIIEFCPYSNSDIIASNPKYDYNGYCNFGNSKYGDDLPFLNDKSYSLIHDDILEEYTNNSFCAFSSILKKGETDIHNIKGILRPTCYQMLCSEKSLTIKIGDEYVVCPRQGGPIQLDSSSAYSGYLICPDYNLICTGTKMCNNLFDCAQKESLYKNSTYYYEYPYYPTNNISSEIKSTNEASLSGDIITDELYELGDKGLCPKYCQRCNSKKQCTVCGQGYIHYIGISEDDEEEIKCSDSPPHQGYYKKTNDSTHIYYYRCLENCITCDNAIECKQCVPTHFVNNSKQCQERIPGCIEYDKEKVINSQDNGGAPSYNECLSCNNSADYYCFDMHREVCIQNPSINLSLYYNMEITDVRLTKKAGEDRLEAYGSITLDGDFVINGIKVMRSKEGNLYVGYPSRRNQQGDYKDICYPMTQTLREDIHIKVMAKYEEL